MFLKLFYKLQMEILLPNSLWNHYYPFTKTKKEYDKKENFRPIALINIDVKILTKYLQTEFINMLKRSYTMMELVSFQWCRNGSTYANQ
jgi:hypothetical protein